MGYEPFIALFVGLAGLIFSLFALLHRDIQKLSNKVDKLRDDMTAGDKELRDLITSEIRRLETKMDADNEKLREETSKGDEMLRTLVTEGDEKLREEMNGEFRLLRAQIEAGFSEIDARLRAVESEQSRVAGLLEGLGIAGRLPRQEVA